MKVATTNSSLLPSILSNSETRLFVITGKGGVGKTTLAMAFTNYLKEKHQVVLYNSFDQIPNYSLLKEANVPYLEHKLEESAKDYMAQKLKSQTIAGWILKTPFFNSLFNMLPGLGHMILLGHLINELEQNPKLRIVLDSPSSGHALTMFESPQNFKEMFQTGLIVNDIKKMEQLILSPEKMKVFVASLPNKMAMQEAREVAQLIKERGISEPGIILNDIYSLTEGIPDAPQNLVPEFLRKKMAIEAEIMGENTQLLHKIPHYSEYSNQEIIHKLTSDLHQWGNLDD